MKTQPGELPQDVCVCFDGGFDHPVGCGGWVGTWDRSLPGVLDLLETRLEVR